MDTQEARRERKLQEQIKAHQGTGFPPDLGALNARSQGVCMRCGGHWDALHTHVWRHYEKDMRSEGIVGRGRLMYEGVRRYRQEYNIPDDEPLDSDEYRETLRQGKLAQMRGPGGERVRSQIARTLSRPRADLYGKTGRNPSGWNPSNWEIAKRLANGVGLVETAKELGGGDNQKLVGRRAESMGLAFSAPFLCDLGAPLRNDSILYLRRISGFEADEFERFVGLPERASTRLGESICNPDDARKVIEWRDGTLRELLQVSASSHCRLRLGSKVYRQDELLQTFLPELAGLNQALVGAKGTGPMGKIREALRENPQWSVDQLGEFICDQAAIEKSGGGENMRWRSTLRYLASGESEKWLKDNVARLCGSNEDDGPIVRELLGARYGVTQETIQNALRERTAVLEPHDIRVLLVTHAPGRVQPLKTPSKPGTPTQPPEQKVWFKIGKKIESLIAAGTPLEEARRAVAGRYPHDTIVTYHKRYRRFLKRP